MNSKKLLIIFVLLIISGTFLMSKVKIIPQPYKVVEKEGCFNLNSKTVIVSPSKNIKAISLMKLIAEGIKNETGYSPEILSKIPSKNDNYIIFSYSKDKSDGSEGYRLNIDNKKIEITAKSDNGLFYAFQTLIQLIPEDLSMTGKMLSAGRNLPSCSIIDFPRYKYRGMHLDVSRHFFPKEFVKKYIDLLAMYKMNTFHWHLTDDHGWRIEIKKYPELTSVCAWRVDREHLPWRERNKEPIRKGEKATYGGFYTQDEIKEVIDYAAKRFIDILPEIEMPGHTSEVFAAFPELSCRGVKLNVAPGSYWPGYDVFCGGNDKVFEFIENVLTEVCKLFPYKYIHIGGDEADKSRWKECKKCQAKIKKEGLKNEEELQSYFIKKVEKILTSKGKKLIGWDEILEGGLAPEATVMSWRGTEGGIAAARQGHDVIMTPDSHCYFNYYQADPAFEPEAIGGFLTLKKVYSFEPTPTELSAKESKHILGAQGNLWSEFIKTPEIAEYMALPRMIALSEVVWSQKESRDWISFQERLQEQFRRLNKMNTKYSMGSFKVEVLPYYDKTRKKTFLKFESEQYNPEIRYTLDGTELNEMSVLYKEPVELSKTSTIKASIFKEGKPYRTSAEQKFIVHKGNGKTIKYNTQYSQKYPGEENALLNGLRGGIEYADGHWQGYNETDLDVVIDLESKTEINKVTIGFNQNLGAWVLLPGTVEIYSSEDNISFEKIGEVKNKIPNVKSGKILEDFIVSLKDIKTRYLRVKALNNNLLPEGHPGAGKKPFIFADEIIIE